MIGRTNVGGGGGGGTAFAYIRVAYPAGGTVRCTDGRKSFIAQDTSGAYVFGVPYAATWTLTLTIDGDSISDTVAITSMYQVESIILNPWNGVAFDNGNQYTNVTGGWYKNTNITPQASGATVGTDCGAGSDAIYLRPKASNQYCFVQTRNKVDITGFSKMAYTVQGYNTTNGANVMLYLSNASSGSMSPSYYTGWRTLSATGEISADITGASGSYYVTLACSPKSGSTNTWVNISNVRFFNDD